MKSPELDFSKIAGFQWDAGNRDKNWRKHRVDYRECEEVFFNRPLLVYEDEGHSPKEIRYYALGITDQKRRLFISFTVRQNHLRVISARSQSRKERKQYETHAS